jgi:hypothetical protein
MIFDPKLIEIGNLSMDNHNHKLSTKHKIASCQIELNPEIAWDQKSFYFLCNKSIFLL